LSDNTENMMQWAGPIASPVARELADRYAVSQLVKVYALGVDMRNYELSRSVFADDAFSEGTLTTARIDEYLPTVFKGVLPYASTQHNITNQFITINGDQATMWSYAMALHFEEKGNGRQNLHLGVQYRDQCQRYPRGWLIKSRKVKLQWVDGPWPRSP
jgi:hypothetical protein